MKSIKTNISLNSFVNKQIKELNKGAKNSRIWFKIIASILSFLNLSMIIVASIAIDLLIKYHNKNIIDDGEAGVILTSLAAGLVVILFVLQLAITIVRAKRKQGIYKNALDKIQLETIKCEKSIGEYSDKLKYKILEEKCKRIKNDALRKKHNKKTSTLIIKGLIGGENV